MKYIDYVQLSPIEKLTYNLGNFFKAIPGALAGFFSAIGKFLKSFIHGIGEFFKDYAAYFKTGGLMTKLSYVIMGAGCVAYGQVVKGIIFFLAEILFIVYMATFGGGYISKFGTLGTVGSHTEMSDDGFEINVPGDDSMLILLFGTLTLVLIVVFIAIYILNIKVAVNCEKIVKSGSKPNTIKEDIKLLTDEKFHITLLTVPTILVSCFTILPLIFMILIAFTNFDGQHQPPNVLFTWVG